VDADERVLPRAAVVAAVQRPLIRRRVPAGDVRGGGRRAAFAVDVAEELGVAAIAFRTVSACAVLAYLSIPGIVDLGELPLPDGGTADLDAPVRGVPGMEGFLRRRDLPVQYRHLTTRETCDEPLLKTMVPATLRHARARALLLNTSASLEAPSLAHLKRAVRDVFAVGPLHTMSPDPAAATSLWRQDDGTAAWLDPRAVRSVVYVSLGSLAVLSRAQSAEFLAGLVAAGYASGRSARALPTPRCGVLPDAQRLELHAGGPRRGRVHGMLALLRQPAGQQPLRGRRVEGRAGHEGRERQKGRGADGEGGNGVRRDQGRGAGSGAAAEPGRRRRRRVGGGV
jgi:hypothetical protein